VLISTYIKNIPSSGHPFPAVEQSMSGMLLLWTAVSSAMMPKLGAAASDSNPSAPAWGNSRSGAASGSIERGVFEIMAAHLPLLAHEPKSALPCAEIV
jgi:hypothetical protein